MHSIISALARIKCFLYSYNTIWMYYLSHLSDILKNKGIGNCRFIFFWTNIFHSLTA